MLPRTAYWYYTKISNTLAVDLDTAEKSVFIHGNGEITVKQGTTVVNDRYGIYRQRRVWTRPLGSLPGPAGDPAGAPIGAFTRGGARYESDGKEKPVDNWFDTPGWLVFNHFNSYEQSLHEWVVGVQNPVTHEIMNNAGCIYFIAIIDLTPDFYRIRMSDSIFFGESDWRAIQGLGGSSPMPANAPLKTNEATGPNAILWLYNSDWLTWGAYNNQLPPGAP